MFLTFGSQQQTLENLCQTGVALEGQIHWAKKSITYFFHSILRERHGFFLCIFCIKKVIECFLFTLFFYILNAHSFEKYI